VRTVSSLAIRRRLRRHRRHIAVTAAVLALVLVIAAHHSSVFMDMTHDMGMNTAVEMCLGVFTAVGTALVAAGVAVVALGRWRPVPARPAGYVPTMPDVPAARARHGPDAVSVLGVSRR